MEPRKFQLCSTVKNDMMADMGLIQRRVMQASQQPVPGDDKGPDTFALSLAGWTPEEIDLYEKILQVMGKIVQGDEAYSSLIERFKEIVTANSEIWSEIDHKDLSHAFGFIISLSGAGSPENLGEKVKALNDSGELRMLIRAAAKELNEQKEQ